MKKFLVKTSLFLFVVAFIINAAMISYLFAVKDDWSAFSHEKNVTLSYSRLEALSDTNKIVIIAGSNGAFSINSRIINKELHMPVVNTSTHAGIGVRMQFEIFKELLRRGDVVVFIPEYDDDSDRLYGNSVLLRIVGTHLPSAWGKITPFQWLHLYKYIGLHDYECYEHRGITTFDGPYSAKSINEYGDIECQREHVDSIKLYALKGNMDKRLIEYYKYVRSYSNNAGVRFVFLPPTLIKSCYDKNKAQIDSVEISLRQNGIPFDASPSRYSFPDSLYFDSPYHMTQSGANKRTERMVADMKRIMGI